MIVGIRDGVKLFGICIMTCCAVFVCNLFLNYNLDLAEIEDLITQPQGVAYFEAFTATGKVVSAVSGGCLLLTSGIMLIFYIKNYIDTHKRELGILKALGYANIRIAKDFWIFGLSVLVGTGIGFGTSFLLMPTLYRVQNEDGLLPDVPIHFHPVLAVCLIGLPTLFFMGLSVFYAWMKLRQPTMALLKEQSRPVRKIRKDKSEKDLPFLQEVKRATLRSRKTLVFFVAFGAFCFSDMLQMSFSMYDLASEMFAALMQVIGIVLSAVTLYLAVSNVIGGNKKTIAMMRVSGYSEKDCRQAILNGYRPWAYIGFAIGTVYQYMLLKIMVEIVFRDMENVPAYEFDIPVFFGTLVVFAAAYELMMRGLAGSIRRVSVKEVMME